jgi:predicted PurR-regulated permease PerM
MMQEQTGTARLWTFSLTTLAFIAIIAVMKLASVVLVPLTVAFFLTLVLSPLVDRVAEAADGFFCGVQRRMGRPGISEKSALSTFFSILFVLLILAFVLVFAYLLVNGQIRMIANNRHEISSRIIEPVQDWLRQNQVLQREEESAAGGMSKALQSVWSHLPGAAGPIISWISTFSFVLFLSTFMMVGRRRISDSLQDSLPTSRLKSWWRVKERAERLTRRFLLTKLITSSITGVAIALYLLLWLEPQYAMLWGFVGFLLNFVPIYGSLLAGAMAVLWTFSIHGLSSWPTIPGLLAINLLVSNALEPKLMDFRLPIGPVNILVGVIFWGWLWGGWGVLMAVPILIVVRVVVEEYFKSNIIAVLMEA